MKLQCFHFNTLHVKGESGGRKLQVYTRSMGTCCTMCFPVCFGLITLLSLEYAVLMTTAEGTIDLSRYSITGVDVFLCCNLHHGLHHLSLTFCSMLTTLACKAFLFSPAYCPWNMLYSSQQLREPLTSQGITSVVLTYFSVVVCLSSMSLLDCLNLLSCMLATLACKAILFSPSMYSQQ